jgi:hypothetical protein
MPPHDMHPQIVRTRKNDALRVTRQDAGDHLICGAAYALDLIAALKRAGLITTNDVTGGYLIARAVQPTAAPYRYRHDAAGLARAAEIGSAA